jgi:polysaccharide pyruvyl transferase WcaK-like protein
MYADDETARAAAAQIPEAQLVSLGLPDADQLTAVFARYDVVVASRLHSIVLAMRAGTPVVAVDGYWSRHTGTSKLLELMRTVDATDRYWRGGPPDDLVAMVQRALRPDAASGQRTAYDAQHEKARTEFDALAEAIQSFASRT